SLLMIVFPGRQQRRLGRLNRTVWSNVMNINLMKSLKIALLGAALVVAGGYANAQKASVGSNMSLNLGKDVKGAHASQGEVGLDNSGNLNAKAAVAAG